MATQVETLLPGNPLAKAEEHGKVIHGEPEEEEGGRHDATKRQTGVGDQESGSDSSSSGSSPGQGGTLGTEKRSSHRASEESKEDCDSQDSPNEEGFKGCNKKDFTEAPPPKVNPWTRKMNAVTVVNVNGQAHNGSYPPYTQIHLPVTVMSVSFSSSLAVRIQQGIDYGHWKTFIELWRRRPSASCPLVAPFRPG